MEELKKQIEKMKKWSTIEKKYLLLYSFKTKEEQKKIEKMNKKEIDILFDKILEIMEE